VIHTNTGIFGKDELLEQFPPVQQRIDLSDHVWLGRLDGDMAEIIMNTCEPKVLGIPESRRQFAQLYSFVRELVSDDMLGWDQDGELMGVVDFSRLVHPTSTGFFYAARVGYETDGVKQILPTKISGISREAFLSPNRTRDWLTDADWPREPTRVSLAVLAPVH
jgi:hypothetical protein